MYAIAYRDSPRGAVKMQERTYDQRHAAQAAVNFQSRSWKARTFWIIPFEDPRLA